MAWLALIRRWRKFSWKASKFLFSYLYRFRKFVLCAKTNKKLVSLSISLSRYRFLFPYLSFSSSHQTWILLRWYSDTFVDLPLSHIIVKVLQHMRNLITDVSKLATSVASLLVTASAVVPGSVSYHFIMAILELGPYMRSFSFLPPIVFSSYSSF